MKASSAKRTSDRRNQHERFVRDAIARSLLTLPFAYLTRVVYAVEELGIEPSFWSRRKVG